MLWYPVIFTGSLQGRITTHGYPCICSVYWNLPMDVYVKLPATWKMGVKKLEEFADIFLGGHLDGKTNGG